MARRILPSVKKASQRNTTAALVCTRRHPFLSQTSPKADAHRRGKRVADLHGRGGASEAEPEPGAARAVYDVVGPVCESGDFLAKERSLAAREGDLLAIMSAGAYGMTMSSNYNSRPRAAEVLVDGSDARLVRRRESIEQLFALEHPQG